VSAELSTIPWYALHVRAHDQTNVELSLRHKGYEVFSPTYFATRRIGGRCKSVLRPLFPGYLFCSFDSQIRLPILMVPGVISILANGNRLIPVEESEIEAIRRTVASGLPVEPFQLIQPGQPVQVWEGPLTGLQGVVVNFKGKNRLIITVSALNNRCISVELDRSAVVPLRDSARVPRPAVQRAG
jgi:transcription termination/antitermination protein NusG